MHSAGGNRSISCPPGHGGNSLVVTAAGAGKVLNRLTNDLFELGFGVGDLPLQTGVVEVIEVGVSHGMTAHFEPQPTKFPQLHLIQISWASNDASRYIKSGVKAEIAQYWYGAEQIGFAAIVEGDSDNTRSMPESFAHTNAPPSLVFNKAHLLAETGCGNDVTCISRRCLAKNSTWSFVFGIHQHHGSMFKRFHNFQSRGPVSPRGRRSTISQRMSRIALRFWLWMF
jgi:hypothetical protein